MTLGGLTGACGLFAAAGSLHPVLAFTADPVHRAWRGRGGALNQWYEAISTR
jgi:protoheme IX farnesyltransferase